MDISLRAYRAAGNRFLAFDARGFPSEMPDGTLAETILRSHDEFDGLLVFRGIEGRSLRLRYLDHRGRSIPFCGNAVRVLPYVAFELGCVPDGHLVVDTPLGSYEVLIRENHGDVVLDLGIPEPIRPGFPVLGEQVWLVGIGALHLVRLIEGVNGAVERWAQDVLKLYPRANVNLSTPVVDGVLSNRTLEGSRGGEVMGCATGSAAAAFAYMCSSGHRTSMRVRVKSGDEIEVNVDPGSMDTSLRGPVHREEDVKERIPWDSRSPS
jgi:diaminopimelate epimerase